MKKYFKSALLLLCSVCLFAACADDNDSNPTLKIPETFVLNTPNYAGYTVDLKSTTDSLSLSWSQPDFGGFPVAAHYMVQVSKGDSFKVSQEQADADQTGAKKADYANLSSVLTDCKYKYSAEDLDKLIEQLNGWDETNIPSKANIFVRVMSYIPTSTSTTDTVYSNVVKLNVAPYYVMLKAAEPELWYLIGACIGDGTWTNSADAVGKSMIPMYVAPDQTYNAKTGKGIIEYVGYLTTAGFKVVKTPGSWDDQLGSSDGALTIVHNDGGSSNICVPSDGYYKITLNTENYSMTVVPYTPAVSTYPQMLIAGDFNGWGTSTAMTACASSNNHDWFYDLDTSADKTTAKFLTDSSWSTNWGGNDFPRGAGAQGGANIPVDAGKYRVFFNDITGVYMFMAK